MGLVLECLTTLAQLAGVTGTLRLGTSALVPRARVDLGRPQAYRSAGASKASSGGRPEEIAEALRAFEAASRPSLVASFGGPGGEAITGQVRRFADEVMAAY